MLSDLAEGLAAAGVDVRVVTSRQCYEAPQANLPHRELLAGVAVYRIRTSRFGRMRLAGRAIDYLSFYLGASVCLLRLLRRGDVSVIMTDPPLLSLVALLVVRLRGARLVNWLQDVYPEVAQALGVLTLPRPLQNAVAALRDASLHAAVANVVLGDRMRDLLAARGVPLTRLRVIENWSEAFAAPSPLPVDSPLRREFDVSGLRVVAYSGNLGRAHEYATLLGAAARLASDGSITFLMIGGGTGMQALRAAVRDAGLENFRFVGYQPRAALAESLAAADVHLVSLRPELEGLIVPSKTYGIFAAGRPAVFVGAADGEIAQLLARYDCGSTVAVGDAVALAQVLRSLLDDPARRRVMGERARAAFERAMTREQAVARWQQLLDEVASISSARSETAEAQ